MKINYTQNGGTVTYDQEDFMTGLDTTSGGITGRKVGNGFAFSQFADPLRNLGYLSPFYVPTDVTNITQVTSLVRNGVVKDTSAYLIAGTNPGSGQSGGIVHKLDNLNAGTISTTSPFPHDINHSHNNEAGYDIVNYYVNVSSTRTLFAFYSFSDDSDWDVGVYKYAADAFDDDWMSTVPASPLASPYLAGGKNAPHPLIVGDDDVLYMGDRNFVHALDGATGANGTFYPAVLTLPEGYIITSFAKSNDRKLMIAAYYAPSQNTSTYYLGDARVWQWNYLDLDPDYSFSLNDNEVSEILNWNEQIIAFSSGRNSQTQTGNYKLQALTGGRFQVLQTWNTGGLPIRGGVMVTETDVYWNGGGVIYFYAKNPFKNNYIFGNLTSGSSAGMLKLFSNTFLLHYSTGSGTGAGLRYAVGDYQATAAAWGKVATPYFPERKRGRLKKVDIYFKNAASGGRTFELLTALDKDGGTSTYGPTSTVTNLKAEVVDYKSNGAVLGDFTTLQPQFTWATGSGATDSPVLEKVVYYFDYININP